VFHTAPAKFCTNLVRALERCLGVALGKSGGNGNFQQNAIFKPMCAQLACQRGVLLGRIQFDKADHAAGAFVVHKATAVYRSVGFAQPQYGLRQRSKISRVAQLVRHMFHDRGRKTVGELK